MEPPACDPGDFCIAQRAESTLFIPEIAKSAGTSKRFQHVSPLPQAREEGVIDASERAFAHHVPMIVGPTANLWVELIDQVGGRHAMRSFDSSSDAIQEGFNILLRRLDEQFPVRISAHVLSEAIKAVLHVRNDGLLRREFKTSFLQKMLDQGLDFSFQ